jgi:hypothetical protein
MLDSVYGMVISCVRVNRRLRNNRVRWSQPGRGRAQPMIYNPTFIPNNTLGSHLGPASSTQIIF